MADFIPHNQDTDPELNRKPGVILVPGSNFVNEVAKFEQWPSKFTVGTQPGNPYRYRPFPKMVYRAQRFNGSPTCFAPEPDPLDYRDPREAERAQLSAQKFNQQCQRIVNDEQELQRACEDNWRESPQEAVECLIERDKARNVEVAHREYDDRNMSDAAKREIRAAKAAAEGEPVPEVKAAPVRKPTYTIRTKKCHKCDRVFTGKRPDVGLRAHKCQ